MGHDYKNIQLTLLNINVENPRFEIVGNQRSAISQMIDDQGTKLSKLAEDILEYGLNPSEWIIAVQDVKSEDHYNVLEGNRRITALKLLYNPDLIPEKHKSLLNSFRKLSKEFYKNPVSEISCIVFQDEKDANRWIKLKHTGENEGVGVVSWDAQQKARFEEHMKGTTSLALQVIDFLKNQQIDNALKNDLATLPSSSLHRLLSDPDFRKTIGIDILNGKIISHFPPEEIIKPLLKVARDLLQKGFTVKDIYYKDDRLNYMETFKQTELPNKKLDLKNGWELIDNYTPLKHVSNQSPSSLEPKKRSKPTFRNSVIPKSTIIPINQNRINKIYRELKDLDAKTFCNAAAITFRVFLELSVDNFIDEKKIPNLSKDDKLRVKVEKVTKYLEDNKIMNKHELKGVRTSISNNNSIHSIDTFNSYIHNKLLSPSHTDLKSTWDYLEPFIVKLWEIS